MRVDTYSFDLWESISRKLLFAERQARKTFHFPRRSGVAFNKHRAPKQTFLSARRFADRLHLLLLSSQAKKPLFIISSSNQLRAAMRHLWLWFLLSAAIQTDAWLPPIVGRGTTSHRTARISRLQAVETGTLVGPPPRNSTAGGAPSFFFGRDRPTTDSFTATTTLGPDPATKPDYDNIVGPLGKRVDNFLLRLFRSKLAEQVGQDSSRAPNDYRAVTELATDLNRRYQHDNTAVQARAVAVLRHLFPAWLPKQYAVLFSRPFPGLAARMNAWATRVLGTWLMGECEVNDVVVVDNSNTTMVLKNQGLLVQRCRFLEESGCASVCVNSCKIPTQTFFRDHMGLPLTMEPDYDTFECQFSFGVAPTEATEAAARATPCLMRCPTAGALRPNHNNNDVLFLSNSSSGRLMPKDQPQPPESEPQQCNLMITTSSDDEKSRIGSSKE